MHNASDRRRLRASCATRPPLPRWPNQQQQHPSTFDANPGTQHPTSILSLSRTWLPSRPFIEFSLKSARRFASPSSPHHHACPAAGTITALPWHSLIRQSGGLPPAHLPRCCVAGPSSGYNDKNQPRGCRIRKLFAVLLSNLSHVVQSALHLGHQLALPVAAAFRADAGSRYADRLPARAQARKAMTEPSFCQWCWFRSR